MRVSAAAQTRVVALAVTVGVLWVVLLRPAYAQTPGVNSQAAALQQFQQHLDAYLRLRQELSRTLKPLSDSASPSELAARQASLAAAVRETRKTAKPGDLIPAPVAEIIGQIVAADMKNRTAADKRGTFEEVPDGLLPRINQAYPVDAALATVPPLLLARLPRLPDNLQYRFYARHVTILDGDLRIVIDYIPNILPPH